MPFDEISLHLHDNVLKSKTHTEQSSNNNYKPHKQKQKSVNTFRILKRVNLAYIQLTISLQMVSNDIKWQKQQFVCQLLIILILSPQLNLMNRMPLLTRHCHFTKQVTASNQH